MMLIMMGSLLTVTTLILQLSRSRLEQSRIQARHTKLETLIYWQSDQLRGHMEGKLRSVEGASGMVPNNLHDHALSTAWITGQKEPEPLHSAGDPLDSITFWGADGKSPLRADWIPMQNHFHPEQYAMAWTIEDLGLSNSGDPPPFWPFPFYAVRPKGSAQSTADFRALWELEPGETEPLWLNVVSPLPFSPEFAPALTPVLHSLALRFSIFASGPIGSREKVIRIRYFIEGTLWNPYNRPMTFHSGSSSRAAFRLEFTGLPRVRIHNMSRGLRTAWIDLNRAANEQSETIGISAWVDLPPAVEAGGYLPFTSPRPERQPEGLARTLHRGFLIGPADRIKLDFEPAGPIGVVAEPLEANGENNPATGKRAWAVLEAPQEGWPELIFNRADAGNQPFYLPNGSLSFTQESAYARFEMRPTVDAGIPDADPRLQTEIGDQATARKRKGLFVDLREGQQPPPNLPPPLALFSWPEKPPSSLLTATDIPWFKNGFRVGWPETSLNAILDHPAAWNPQAIPMQAPNETDWHDYSRCIPINCISPDMWYETITASALRMNETWRFGAFGTVNPDFQGDHINIPDEDLRAGSTAMATLGSEAPLPSIAEFFSSSRPLAAMGSLPDSLTPVQSLPFKALFRNGPPPARHSSAWLIHLAARFKDESSVTFKTARFWLIETISKSEGTHSLKLIHAEFTDPSVHLRLTNQSQADPSHPAREIGRLLQ
jgi:hypothetical protein